MPPLTVGRVAVVGAGVAGLACARTLLDRGADVVVFDKGRAPGGRLATHRSPAFDADVGAPYFTVRDERFGRVVRSWIEEGVVAPWRGRIRALPSGEATPIETPSVERFVGTPGMSAIARRLGRGIEVSVSHRIDRIERDGPRFALAGAVADAGVTLGPRGAGDPSPLVDFGAFDALVLCLPSNQIAPLVRDANPAIADAVSRIACEPCLSLGFAPEGDALRDLPFDGLFIGRDGDPGRILSWLARDSSKPGRRPEESWVVHAAPEWSRANLREPNAVVEDAMFGELARLLRVPRFGVKGTTLRRWAFARAPSSFGAGPIFDEDAKLGVGGDWSVGGRIEGAFLSGVALAERCLGVAHGDSRDGPHAP